MTERKVAPDVEPEDLSIRARRGDLGTDGQRALEHALRSQPTFRTAHQLGRDFDEQSRVRSGDDEIILRAAGRAIEQHAHAHTHRSKRLALLVGLSAAVLAISSAAAPGRFAGWFGLGEVASSSRPAETPRDRAHDERSGTAVSWPTERQPRPSAAASAPLATATASSDPSPEPRRLEPDAARSAKAKVKASPVEEETLASDTAASLFREAGQSRHDGDIHRAIALFTELQSKFPDTREANTSRVSLGKLLLATGHAREAERQFAAYLALGGAALEEEALVGRAEALAQLGANGEERRAWQELLRRHGSSVYAARATVRLRALEASDPAAPR